MTSASTSLRTIEAIHETVRDDIGDLVTRRALPTPTVPQIDPFLFLNHHGPQIYVQNNNGLPFAPHPHRGFETVTFIREGDLSHADSGGHKSVIDAKGVQWMTAGRGLIHEELSSDKFKRDGGPLEILQLWVNLPKRLKMTEPKYLGLQSDKIPKVQDNHSEIEIVSGKWKGTSGAFNPLIDIQLFVITVEAGTQLETPEIESARNIFFYVIDGELVVNGRVASRFQLVEFANDGTRIEIEARSRSKILFGHALPFGEPVVSYGPFVMTTREEILEAIQDYNNGLFD